MGGLETAACAGRFAFPAIGFFSPGFRPALDSSRAHGSVGEKGRKERSAGSWRVEKCKGARGDEGRNGAKAEGVKRMKRAGDEGGGEAPVIFFCPFSLNGGAPNRIDAAA